jgi:hypothetical protein
MTRNATFLTAFAAFALLSCNRPPQSTNAGHQQSITAQQGANTHIDATSNTVLTPKNEKHPGVTVDEVSSIAKTEAHRRRGVEAVVYSLKYDQHRWLAFLKDRDSNAVGSFCWVEVDTNGVVVAYHPGR